MTENQITERIAVLATALRFPTAKEVDDALVAALLATLALIPVAEQPKE